MGCCIAYHCVRNMMFKSHPLCSRCPFCSAGRCATILRSGKDAEAPFQFCFCFPFHYRVSFKHFEATNYIDTLEQTTQHTVPVSFFRDVIIFLKSQIYIYFTHIHILNYMFAFIRQLLVAHCRNSISGRSNSKLCQHC